ncbi:MAG: SRPBCC family protein [Candidatus Methanoperedens sp.]
MAKNKGLIAKASISINAPVGKVWDALTKPEVIKQYMFGTNVISDWKQGSPIFWKGEWQGKKYEDKGIILKLEPNRILQYTHFSPLSGQQDQDMPENYHTVTIELSAEGAQTRISLSQDNNPTEQARGHSENNWVMMLASLKKLLEK